MNRTTVKDCLRAGGWSNHRQLSGFICSSQQQNKQRVINYRPRITLLCRINTKVFLIIILIFHTEHTDRCC